MSAARSVIPSCGDTRRRWHKAPAVVLAGSLAFDFALVWLFLAVLS
jgi:hypothetical protein